MVVQTTIDEEGEPQRKLRLTHDQSFKPKRSSGRSVNDRVDETTLTRARFGKAFIGGSPNPSLWSDVSEVVTNLANDLVRRSDWDLTRHHSPHQPLLELDRAKDDNTDGTLVGKRPHRTIRLRTSCRVLIATWTTDSAPSTAATKQRAWQRS